MAYLGGLEGLASFCGQIELTAVISHRREKGPDLRPALVLALVAAPIALP